MGYDGLRVQYGQPNGAARLLLRCRCAAILSGALEGLC